MKKIVVVLLFVSLLCMLFSGCSTIFNKSDLTEADAKKYLDEKYQGTFSFVEENKDDWIFSTTKYIFRDFNGKECTVEQENDVFTDNYYATKYDSDWSNELQSKFENDVKVFVSTEHHYGDKFEKFSSLNGYIRSMHTVNIEIYSEKELSTSDIENIKSTLNAFNSEKMSHLLMHIEIKLVSGNTFYEVEGFGTVKNYDVLSTTKIELSPK